jgi:hypothetical protein
MLFKGNVTNVTASFTQRAGGGVVMQERLNYEADLIGITKSTRYLNHTRRPSFRYSIRFSSAVARAGETRLLPNIQKARENL